MNEPTQLVISEQAIREAVEADFKQHMIQSYTPDRGYLTPIDNVRALLNSQREAIIRECAEIVHDEPNLPGEMPDDFYASVCSSKDKATNMFRSTVDVTMDNIKKRILAKLQNK